MTVGHLDESVRIALSEARESGDPRRASDLSRDEAEARAERLTIAKSILDTLPPFVRDARRHELESRLTTPLVSASLITGDASRLILGPTAAGKTVAMALAFRRILARGVREAGPAWTLASGARWFDASELARARRGWPLGHGDPPQFEQASRASILFLDDLGQERADDGSIRDVLNARYEATLPTVVTSGLRMPELVARYDAQIVRRILQGGELIDLFERSE